MVTSRSDGATSLSRARSRVVLPVPVPPAMTMLRRALTAAARNSRNARSTRPRSWSSSSVDSLEAVTTDDHRRPGRHLDRREQPRAVGELEVQLRVGGVEPALGPARSRGRPPDQLDQLVVGRHHGRHRDPAPVTELEPHRFVAADVDVVDVGVVEQRLDAARTRAPCRARRRPTPVRLRCSRSS